MLQFEMSWCCSISADCSLFVSSPTTGNTPFLSINQLFFILFPCNVWVSQSGCPSSQMSCCAPSCVLASSPPPVQPCWTSLYHPSTMPSHHVGRSKRGWNANFIIGILIWGREEYKIQSGPNFQGYLVAELRDAHALKHCHAIIFNCFFSVPAPCCLTPESDTVEHGVYKYNVWQKNSPWPCRVHYIQLSVLIHKVIQRISLEVTGVCVHCLAISSQSV